MDSIDRWLKSLRLHKYTHLFKTLTYEQMLNIDEKYLIDLDITKGARNKILVSVKKLNLRTERLVNMIDDLNQGNISMKEALNVLKDMLITPIPHPYDESRSKLTASCSPSSISSSTGTSESAFVTSPSSLATSSSNSGGSSDDDDDNNACYPVHSAQPTSGHNSLTTPMNESTLKTASPFYQAILATAAPIISDYFMNESPSTTISNTPNQQQYYLDPHELTYLFVNTFERLVKRLIESNIIEDSACHGIMADIVDECLKHNSFTNEQKAKMARYKQRVLLEQKAKQARNKHQQHQQQLPQSHHMMREQKAKSTAFKQPHLVPRLHHGYNQHPRLEHTFLTNHHYHQQPSLQPQCQVPHNQHQAQQIQCLSTVNSNGNHHQAYQSNQLHHHYHNHHNHHQLNRNLLQQQHQQQAQLIPSQPMVTVGYGEYSLLGPGKTFELPCLRAMAERSSRKS